MKYTDLKFANCLKMAVLTMVLIGAGALANDVRAQTARVFKIEVPFDFVIKHQTYEAGTYRIGRLSESNPDILILKNAADKKSLILQTVRLSSGAPAAFSKLSFRRYGEMYFLDSIRASGETYESRLPTAKSDRRLGMSVELREIVSTTAK